MADARAIRAAFTEYRMVKTRSALQLIVEVPLEQQADVFNKLGYPLPCPVAFGFLIWAEVILPEKRNNIASSNSPEAP